MKKMAIAIEVLNVFLSRATEFRNPLLPTKLLKRNK